MPENGLTILSFTLKIFSAHRSHPEVAGSSPASSMVEEALSAYQGPLCEGLGVSCGELSLSVASGRPDISEGGEDALSTSAASTAGSRAPRSSTSSDLWDRARTDDVVREAMAF
jgi:hypothetical protein